MIAKLPHFAIPLLLSTLVLGACDAGPPESPAKQPEAKAELPGVEAEAKQPGDETKQPEASADTKQPEASADTTEADAEAAQNKAKAKQKFAEHDEAKLAASRTKMVQILNAGRKLVKEGKLDAGIAKYQELLAIDPHYGPALGELGWAEFKAGSYAPAKAHTLKALTRAPDNKRRGMLHYNLGRIAEAQKQTEVAIEAYAVSLSLRPNQVVADRLSSLTHVESAEGMVFEHPAVDAYNAARAPGAKTTLGLNPVELDSLPSIEAACEHLLSDWDDDADAHCELVASPTGDASWGMIETDFYSIERYWSPAMKTERGWVLFTNSMYAQHGSEIDQDIDSLSSRVVTNESGSYLLIEYSDHIYERDWSWGELEEDEEIPDEEIADSSGVIICTRTPKPICTHPILTAYEYRYGDRRDSFSATVRIEGAAIVVAEVTSKGQVMAEDDESWEFATPLAAGEYPISALTP